MPEKSRNNIFSFSLNETSSYMDNSLSGRGKDESRRKSNLSVFDLTLVIVATNNFFSHNKLREYGFGPVYKVASP